MCESCWYFTRPRCIEKTTTRLLCVAVNRLHFLLINILLVWNPFARDWAIPKPWGRTDVTTQRDQASRCRHRSSTCFETPGHKSCPDDLFHLERQDGNLRLSSLVVVMKGFWPLIWILQNTSAPAVRSHGLHSSITLYTVGDSATKYHFTLLHFTLLYHFQYLCVLCGLILHFYKITTLCILAPMMLYNTWVHKDMFCMSSFVHERLIWNLNDPGNGILGKLLTKHFGGQSAAITICWYTSFVSYIYTYKIS